MELKKIRSWIFGKFFVIEIYDILLYEIIEY